MLSFMHVIYISVELKTVVFHVLNCFLVDPALELVSIKIAFPSDQSTQRKAHASEVYMCEKSFNKYSV